LTKKKFFAEQWLQKDNSEELQIPMPASEKTPEKCPIKGRFPTFIHHQKKQTHVQVSDRFSPLNCFTPGWKGDSLPSKSVVKFERLLKTVQNDIKTELFKTRDFPRTIKIGLYNEFLSYAESIGLIDERLGDLASFWKLLHPEKLEENKELSDFIDIYANRVATITFLKLRFISALLERTGLEMSDKALLYPTSFLSQIFKKGSGAELHSAALESNLYSWYRPHEGMKECMRELMQLSKELSIAEIIKCISRKTLGNQEDGRIYSHALSHVSVGLFLNSLQINYPMWLETIEGQALPAGSLEQQRIISCKYFGDYLESLSLSHWLAQENNKDFRWDEMLCPDFKGLEFISGSFTKICNELQFLTFLAYKAEHQNERVVEYICKIMGGHYRNRKGGQKTDLLADNPFYSSTYDRVVLNLCQFPKNNPQHYLMAQILDQVKYLKANGYLFVLSSKKLFVPSLRERLEPIFRELKIEAIFDLEDVKGKGELGSYIYIFRKSSEPTERQLCSFFRISADLESFTQFSSITEHLRSFYLSHLNEIPPMAHLEFPDTFRLEFFQEAVVNGMLIHSASEDSGRITHPTYFKSLLENCVPLETLFDIRSMSHEESATKFNGLNLGLKKDLSYFLVVDFRHSEVNLELHPMDTYRSIYSEYGQTLCSYFELQPRLPGLNPNVLRNYFSTATGKQIAHLTFSGGPNLVKGSLSKFFVPKFLTQTEGLPAHLATGFSILEMEEDALLESSPQTLVKSFNHIDHITRDLFPKHACEILSRLSKFERTLQSIIWRMEDNRLDQKFSFSNPVVQSQLVQKKTNPLYPDNQDIFLEFVAGSSAHDLHLALTETQITVTHEGDLKLHALELISQGRVVVRMHAEEQLVQFVNYLLGHALNVPISTLLKAIHIPGLSDLKLVMENSKNNKDTYEQLLKKVQSSIMDAFRMQLLPVKRL
jgi:hypothetical protein